MIEPLNPLESKQSDDPFEKISACIHCGFCLPTCPTYRVTGSEAESPRGRLYLMKAFYEDQLDSPKQLSDHLDPCLGCLGCVTVCPSGVDYESLLHMSRQSLLPSQSPLKRAFRRFLLTTVLPNPTTLGLLARLTRLYTNSGAATLIENLRLPQWGGFLGKLVPFTPRLQTLSPIPVHTTYGENRKGRVALFTGCIMNAAYADTHRATITVLTQNGYQVIVPEQTCCGALAYHSGETDIVETLAEQNIDGILAANPDWIVVNAAGCGSTLKEYNHILSRHPNAQAFQQKVVDVLELLAREPLEGFTQDVSITATYHAACHLHHAQRIQEEPYAVLRQIPGLNLVPLREAELCCGSAGVYNLAHPDLSLDILNLKLDTLVETQATVVLAANPGCMLQLETGLRQRQLPMQVMHPIDLIAMAYDSFALKTH